MNNTVLGLLVVALILLFGVVSFYLDFIRKKDKSN